MVSRMRSNFLFLVSMAYMTKGADATTCIGSKYSTHKRRSVCELPNQLPKQKICMPATKLMFFIRLGPLLQHPGGLHPPGKTFSMAISHKENTVSALCALSRCTELSTSADSNFSMLWCLCVCVQPPQRKELDASVPLILIPSLTFLSAIVIQIHQTW